MKGLISLSSSVCIFLYMTERLPFHLSLSCIGEGNGNSLQCSSLENSMDSRVWRATVHRVTKSQSLSLTLCDPMDCRTRTGFPGPSLSPRVDSNSCPLSQWCHLTISSFVVPFSSCLLSFPALGSFPMSQLFTSGGQSIGVSTQHQSFHWIFRTDFL